MKLLTLVDTCQPYKIPLDKMVSSKVEEYSLLLRGTSDSYHHQSEVIHMFSYFGQQATLMKVKEEVNNISIFLWMCHLKKFPDQTNLLFHVFFIFLISLLFMYLQISTPLNATHLFFTELYPTFSFVYNLLSKLGVIVI